MILCRRVWARHTNTIQLAGVVAFALWCGWLVEQVLK